MFMKMLKADPEWRWKAILCAVLFTVAMATYFGLTAYLKHKQETESASMTPAPQVIVKPIPRPSKQRFRGNTEC